MTGEGRDMIGSFLIRGKYNIDDGKCHWSKRYVGKHDVAYQGYNEGKGIWGVWEIPPTWRGGFHIWPTAMGDPTSPEAQQKRSTSRFEFEQRSGSRGSASRGVAAGRCRCRSSYLPNRAQPRRRRADGGLAAKPASQILGKILTARIAMIRPFGQCLLADCSQRAGTPGGDRVKWGRIVVNRVEDHVRRRPAERRLAAQKLIEDRPQAVLVTRRQHVGLPALGLLGSNIGRSTEDHPGKRHLTRVRTVGDAKIHEVDNTLGIETNVGRLDVAVHDPLAVGIRQCLGKLSDDLRSAV